MVNSSSWETGRHPVGPAVEPGLVWIWGNSAPLGTYFTPLHMCPDHKESQGEQCRSTLAHLTGLQLVNVVYVQRGLGERRAYGHHWVLFD